ncbi:MAG: 50S ribosomal protein L25/general stress protein Ctc [Acidobacteria bacterium]|nr:MAG: 50S ribosomal protein L25/general stress protein Ctc [Acidobacteriota bacterium]
MSEVTIEVQKRQATGKNANRRLRAGGKLPAVVYGAGQEAVPIVVESDAISNVLRTASGENTLFLLKLAGSKSTRHAMIRELQSDPITGRLIHVDFQRIKMSETVNVQVPVEIVGQAKGVKNQGGILDFVSREVEVECLPNNIPPAIELDVSELEIGDHVEAGQLSLPEGVKLLDEPERVIVSIAAPAIVEEKAEEEEEELLEAKAEEPEVIGREKEDEG